MDWKSFLGLSRKKRNVGEFDSLFSDIEEIENHEEKFSSKNKSLYGDKEEFFMPPKKKGFYGLSGDVDDERKQDEYERKVAQHNVFNFSWWEYAIIFIEFILLVYVILLFLGVFNI